MSRAFITTLAVTIFSASMAYPAFGGQVTDTVAQSPSYPALNGQITDSVPQTDPAVLGVSPAEAMSSLYQVTARAIAGSTPTDSESERSDANSLGISVIAIVAHTQAYLLNN